MVDAYKSAINMHGRMCRSHLGVDVSVGLRWSELRFSTHPTQLPTGEAFLGAPPERLYVRTHGAVASEAVAGTRPRGPVGDEAEDARLAEELLSSPKENTEFTVVREWVQEVRGDGGDAGAGHGRRTLVQKLRCRTHFV